MTREDLLRMIERPGAALLDGWSDRGRWTIALPEPVEEFRAELDELDRLDSFLEARGADLGQNSAPDQPFVGGWVGWISYEAGAAWEGARPRSDASVPAALFYKHERVIAIGPGEERTDAFRASPPAPLRNAERGGRPSHAQAGRGEASSSPAGVGAIIEMGDSLSGDRYRSAHEAIRDGIASGDFYQVNLTRRLRASRPPGDARELFASLTGDPPPLYSAFVRTPDLEILSASPEMFLRADLREGSVEMRPIKGTAPRHTDPERDRALAASLSASGKDRAENVMIVDLCRNDLGRVCENGSVAVAELCRLASHRVHHLESVIRGRLRAGSSPRDIFRATFPPGSVTGAPKRAAVAAIRRLEPVSRGVYCGAIGYFDRRGRLAFNVAIRTAALRNEVVDYHSGGGITWGSVADLEDEETKWKAAEFFAMLGEGSGA